jgi:hypothetical protein
MAEKNETIPQIVARRVDETNKLMAQPLIDQIISAQRNIKAQQAQIAEWQIKLADLQTLSTEDVTGEAS